MPVGSELFALCTTALQESLFQGSITNGKARCPGPLACLIQTCWCVYLIKAIPEQVVCLFFRNIIMVDFCYHIGGSGELALLQVHEIDVLRSLFPVCACRQDGDGLEFIVC